MTDNWKEFSPGVLPVGWHMEEERSDGAQWVKWVSERHYRSVILSISVELDDQPWVHLSIARSDRLPTWQELNEVRDIWLPKRRCIQVLAPPAEHININPNCLHLWHCLGKDPVPDFAHGGNSI